MVSPGFESALIIEVPEAEAAVHRYRERLDANALLGIPAHITVLAPFMPPQMINATVLTQLGQLFADFRTDLRAAEEAIQDSLPIDARTAAVALMAEQSAGGNWTKTATFTLG